MKSKFILFALLCLFSCSTEPKEKDTVIRPPVKKENQESLKPVEKPDLWKAFWTDFQAAVAAQNIDKIASHIEFPLKGSDVFNKGKLVTKENFALFYQKIFDEKTRSVIAETENMSEYATQKKEIADRFNVPTNKKIRTFLVNYVYNEGKPNQTESTVTFQFVEVASGLFKLYSLTTAG
ncbi:MAG: hypothetical protein AB8F74_19205 [Saprospiraceae bacterium]